MPGDQHLSQEPAERRVVLLTLARVPAMTAPST
jgi:hypothetical protein